jgi:uncharacterized protein YjlB
LRPHKIEPVKRLLEKSTGIGIPSTADALSRLRVIRPVRLRFRDDGYIPNNPKHPLLLYRKAVRFEASDDPAAVLEVIFNERGWGEAWRNGIYDFVHYHPRIHEVLGVARGSAELRLGGNKGKTVKVGIGDIVVIPAGVGHECIRPSKSFLVVGAYPKTGTYSENRGSFREIAKAQRDVRRVKPPRRNPVTGEKGW